MKAKIILLKKVKLHKIYYKNIIGDTKKQYLKTGPSYPQYFIWPQVINGRDHISICVRSGCCDNKSENLQCYEQKY